MGTPEKIRILFNRVEKDDSEQNRAKRAALDEWVRAVNQKGGFGQWCWDVAFEPAQVQDVLAKHVGASLGQMIGNSFATEIGASRNRRTTHDAMSVSLEHEVLADFESAPALLQTLPAAMTGPVNDMELLSSAPDDEQAELLNDPRNLPVWFGTNRAPVNPEDLSLGFSGEWSDSTTLGRCIVNVPKGHVPGETGSAWWIRLVKGDDRLHIVSIEMLPNFWSQISEAMQTPRENGVTKEALFFLHGYNVTFEQAATWRLASLCRIAPRAQRAIVRHGTPRLAS